ncbi:MAG: phosphoribosyl-AMP cyclohydrolase [Spirochaetota bacterium]
MNKIKIDFDKLEGIIPAIIQDAADGQVLMLGFMNREAFEKTVKTGYAHFWSRSRKKLWMKGETSGHTQAVQEIRIDCDNDTLLIKVIQKGGAACHEGYKSCFYRTLNKGTATVDGEKIFNPEDIY